MESYEHFYSRTLKTLCNTHCSTAPQQQRAMCNTCCSTAPQQQRALCNIHFHGRRLLEPVLSEDLRVQVCEYRRRAVERDSRRHTHTLLQRVQDILNNIHQKKTENESDSAVTSTSDPSPSLGPETPPGQNQSLSLKRETLRLLNQRMEKLVCDESGDGPDPESPDSTLASLSLSLMGSYAQLPGPTLSRSPDTHRARRPRTHTTGNILISRPVSESELRASASECQSDSGDNKQCLMEKSGLKASSPAPSGAEWNCSGSELSDGQLSIITSTPSSHVTRERTGSARRSPPAPLNRSYDVENPSPSLIRPQISGTHQTAVEQQIHALEHLEREHTHQISELLAAQERQTQELQRKLNEQSRKSMMSSAPQINTRQDVCVDQMKPLCRLTAVARGFLTRRLLHTEKITHLRKTVQDSRALIHQLKTVSVSHQDLTLQQRVTAQLRSALHDVHQIFFMWPLRDRLHLMQQDRERRRERTLREMTDSAGNTRTLSSATRKTLDRKGQRHAKKMTVIPKSSPARILQCRLSQNTVCSSQSALKKRDGCVGVRQHSLQRKYLSLG
ncbi:uncharacterized protein LOC143738772 isoform X2 [Siphateles boraxobius]|uniref:uncharacterized protein LOC143738772 isoform X2 n=1 Tax=Siphateles boraxobius TaxID=180520 RepID=UPI004064BC1E